MKNEIIYFEKKKKKYKKNKKEKIGREETKNREKKMLSHGQSRIEWVEIIEPRTREHMYANLTTGECVWDPPEGVNIKRTDDSQWWELFDKNTKRFYYYNVSSQTTAWHRPTNCDIIPLAKLQTLKQNTDPNDARDDFPGSSNSKYGTDQRYDDTNRSHGSASNTSNILPPPSAPESRSADILSHISERHNSYSRLSPGDSASTGKTKSHRYCRHAQGSTPSHGGKPNLDSGKSSDSSLSSSYRHGHDSGSLRMDQRSKHLADNTYRKMQESSSSHSIPHVALSSDSKAPSISYSASHTTDMSSAQSTNTPQFKKKLLSEKSPSSSARESGHIAKHQSFDYAKNSPMVSLVRSGSFMSTPKQTNIVKKGSIDGNGGGASDDSMHEKYFKSVENTPVSKRRNQSLSACTNQKHSSDSSPHSPMSPKKNTLRASRPTALSSTAEPFHLFKSSQDTNNSLEKSSKHERYLEKMRKEMPNKTSPSSEAIEHSTSAVSISKINNLFKPSSSTSTNKSSASSHYNSNSIGKSSTGKEKSNSHTQYMDRYNSLSEKQDRKTSSIKAKKHQSSANSDVDYVEYDNDNMSPLYSNWDQETQEHLLPLQHYIIEQAKLSGSYHMGDALDSDSLHSDSQSEHSFSGHEPDNEDSDHSDSQGDYLAHHYSTTMDDYGEVYYNVHIGYERNQKQDNISEEVEHRLERECGQIYSPIKNHPFFQQQPQPQSQPYNSHQSQKSQPSQQPQPKPQPHQTQSKTGTTQSQQSKKSQPESDVANYQKTQPQFSQPYANLPNVTKAMPSKLPPTLPIMKECNIEKFAQDNLNLHSKGLFRKKSSIRDMLSWTPDSISRPMLAVSRDKATKKMATEMFKLIQIYMGDRKARDGMSLNSVAMDIITTALAQPPLRDELYIQLCRQTTENHIRGSLIRGWELLAICLSFLPPSPTFQPALLNYMNRHRDPTFATTFPEVGKWPIHVQVSHYATVACRRLERIGSNGKKQAKKPNEDEIEQSREQIIRKSMFGNTLDEVMELQKDRFPYRKLPWIQVTLSQQVLLLNGTQTEGIFRVSADVDEVAYWKARLDRWDVPEHKSTMDAHAPASLLKLWYRELYDPLIPDELYEECVATEDPETAAAIVNRLPPLNKLVLTYLVYFLQQFSQPDIVACTKMDSSNLAMVFAPNCLRCTSQDPKVILENARKEMSFMRTLISHMDTSSVVNLE